LHQAHTPGNGAQLICEKIIYPYNYFQCGALIQAPHSHLADVIHAAAKLFRSKFTQRTMPSTSTSTPVPIWMTERIRMATCPSAVACAVARK
jgi:hypothetical protein